LAGEEAARQRRAWIISLALHGILFLPLLLLAPLWAPKLGEQAAAEIGEPAEIRQRVLLPPRDLLRQIVPAPPKSMPKPLQARVPPPDRGKDRISVGPPSDQRARELLLRREDDLTKAGTSGGSHKGTPAVEPPSSVNADSSKKVEVAEARRDALTWPMQGQRKERRSLRSALADWSERMAHEGGSGVGEGTGGAGRQMGPLFFDPQGADFTLWINHFKNEVYRGWIVPQSVLMGLQGRVELEFSVDRAGKLVALQLLASAGTPALDRAAANALVGSRLLPLPADYAPAQITMRVVFFYNRGPGG
jgi:TonB family protein